MEALCKGFSGAMYRVEMGCMKAFFGTQFVLYFVISYIGGKACFSHRKKSLTLWSASKLNKVIVISKGTELLRIPADRLVFVSAEGNYSEVVTQDNRKRIVSFQLGQIEDMIGDQLGDEGSNFIRLGRGLIINLDFVYWVDVAKQTLILSDCAGCYHELTASREVLIKLKAYIDAIVKNG